MIAFFIPEKKRQAIFFALLTGLMVAWQLQAGNEFRRQWANQADFYRELLWRAPSLTRNTAVLVNSEAFSVLRGSAFTLNTVYEQPPTDQGQLAYWIFSLDSLAVSQNPAASTNGTELKDGRYTTSFSGNRQDAVVIDFRQDENRCLWVINPDQAFYSAQSNTFKSLSNANPLERISKNSDKKYQVIEELYGNVQTPAWCYFFEKADLARQLGEWETIPTLWDQAETLDIHPGNGLEYLPFIEAYARLNDWDKAFVLTRQANRSLPQMASALCPLWQRLNKDLPASDGKANSFQKTNQLLGCLE